MPPDTLQRLTFDDFSYGIYDRTGYVGATRSLAPFGAAERTNTYRCFALPSGALAPLPRRDYTYDHPSLPDSGNSITYVVTGFLAAGQINNTGGATNNDHPVEFHLPLEYDFDDGAGTTERRYRWQRHPIFNSSGSVDTLKSINSASTFGADDTRYTWLAVGRMNPSTPTDPGVPIVAAAWFAGDGSVAGERFVSVFPDPAAASTTGVRDIHTANPIGMLVAHQNRLVMFRQTDDGHGANAAWVTNENIIYTDENDDALVSSTPDVFMPEWVGTYVDGASMAADELLLIKSGRGGLTLHGSLEDVTAFPRPELISGHGEFNIVGAHGLGGYVYWADFFGAYLWSGGQSVHLSPQLDGTFAHLEALVDQLGPSGKADRWGDWVVLPRNWLLQLAEDGQPRWWRLDNPTAVDVAYFSAATTRERLYGAVAEVTDADATIVHGWDLNEPAHDFSWQSHPVWLADPRSSPKLVEAREIVLRASGVGTVTVTVTNEAGSSVSQAFTVADVNVPRVQVADIALQGEWLQVRVQSDGTAGPNAAPIVHEVEVGYQPAAHVAKT